VTFTAILAGRGLGIRAGLFLASRQNVACFSVAAIYGATLVETLHLMLPGPRLTSLLTGWGRALRDALEEAVDRAAKARLAVTAILYTRIEHRKRRPYTVVTALPGGHAVPIGSRVKNVCELGPFSTGVGTAALKNENGSCKNREYGCCVFHDCAPGLQGVMPNERRAYTKTPATASSV
jgi:hypothetical protein